MRFPDENRDVRKVTHSESTEVFLSDVSKVQSVSLKTMGQMNVAVLFEGNCTATLGFPNNDWLIYYLTKHDRGISSMGKVARQSCVIGLRKPLVLMDTLGLWVLFQRIQIAIDANN